MILFRRKWSVYISFSKLERFKPINLIKISLPCDIFPVWRLHLRKHARAHTHTHTDIYIYIYIYIYCHPQTDSFVPSELFGVARHVGRSKPGSKPIQLYVRLSLRPLSQQAYHVWLRELLRYLCSNNSSVCLHFYTLSATRELNSFEELCIMRAAAKNSL